MNWLKRFFDFYIDASIHVGLAVMSLTYVCLTKLELPIENYMLLFNFFATILGYNFVKYFSVLELLNFKSKNKKFLLLSLSLLAVLFVIYFSITLRLEAILILILSFLLTLFYSVPIPYLKRVFQHNLRNISGLKIFVIAFVWALTTITFPVLQNNQIVTIPVLLLFSQIFIAVILLMIPFEVRDLSYDNLSLKTLPQQLGVIGVKRLGYVLGISMLILEVFISDINNKHFYITVVIVFILILFILFSKKKQPKYYSSFWVEAVPIFWCLLLLIF